MNCKPVDLLYEIDFSYITMYSAYAYMGLSYSNDGKFACF